MRPGAQERDAQYFRTPRTTGPLAGHNRPARRAGTRDNPSAVLLTRLVSFMSGTARGKRLLWRGWYQFLAARYRDPRWTFMNYGYRSPEAPAPPLDPGDEPDRSCIQLYDVVASGAPRATTS